MFSVSARTSAKIGRAPRRASALAVDVKVNEGRTNSSPGPRSRSRPHISSASVHEVVKSARLHPSLDSRSLEQRCENIPPPDNWPAARLASRYSRSFPTKDGRLNGIRIGVIYLPQARAPKPPASCFELRHFQMYSGALAPTLNSRSTIDT